MKKIIFHSPIDIFGSPDSGDMVRPRKMYEAFKSLGMDVILCHGDSYTRAQKIKEILGGELDNVVGVYSEFSSRPIYITDPDRVPRIFNQDFNFFKNLKLLGIPVGIYYRDIHWLYPDQTSSPQKRWKKPLSYLLHVLELLQIKQCADIFFLPSEIMAEYIPKVFRPKNYVALPPGCDVHEVVAEFCESELQLFYVGGATPPLYDLSIMLSAVAELEGVKLTLCVREAEWQRCNYCIPTNVNIIHASGDELINFFKKSHILLMVYPYSEYREFAVPVKLYEAIGYTLPVIAADHGATSSALMKNKFGWVVNGVEDLREFLVQLTTNRRLLVDMRLRVKSAQKENTWRVRAREVTDLLINTPDSGIN